MRPFSPAPAERVRDPGPLQIPGESQDGDSATTVVKRSVDEEQVSSEEHYESAVASREHSGEHDEHDEHEYDEHGHDEHGHGTLAGHEVKGHSKSSNASRAGHERGRERRWSVTDDGVVSD